MITMIDGVSGTGKSTLLFKWMQHKSFHIYRHNSFMPADYNKWVALIRHDLERGESVLWDRFFVSDYVYTRLRNEESELTDGQIKSLLRQFEYGIQAELWLPYKEPAPQPPERITEIKLFQEFGQKFNIPVRWRPDIGTAKG